MPEDIQMPNGWAPRPCQQAIWDYMLQDKDNLRCVDVAHRRRGKDSVALNVMSTKSAMRPAVYYYMGPSQKQVRKIVWDNVDSEGRRMIDQAFPKSLRAKKGGFNDQEMRLILTNGSIVQFLGSDNYDSIMGSNPYGMVFSEWAIAERPEAWDYFQPILIENGGWAMFPYTPRGLNHGYKLYRTALANPDEWHCSLQTVEDTGIVTLEQIDKLRRDGMSELKIRQEFYCEFIADTEKQVFNIEAVLAAQAEPTPQDDPHAACIVGVDCARYGDDRSVISTRIGRDFKSVPLKVFGRLDNVQLANEVYNHWLQYKPDAIFIDETGQGSGVVDALKHIHRLPAHCRVGINFGAKATNRDVYKNMRAEMHDKFANWLLEPDVSLQKSQELLEELSSILWGDPDVMGRLVVERKEVIKKRTGFSPDITDSMILTFARPVMRKDVRRRLLRNNNGRNDPPRAIMS